MAKRGGRTHVDGEDEDAEEEEEEEEDEEEDQLNNSNAILRLVHSHPPSLNISNIVELASLLSCFTDVLQIC